MGQKAKSADDRFTQDRNAWARAGSHQPLGRIQVTRKTTGGELHAMLLSGEQ